MGVLPRRRAISGAENSRAWSRTNAFSSLDHGFFQLVSRSSAVRFRILFTLRLGSISLMRCMALCSLEGPLAAPDFRMASRAAFQTRGRLSEGIRGSLF